MSPTRRTVLVTDARRGVAVATIRSLAQAGYRVVAADCHRVSPGRWSRHAWRSVSYPDPLDDQNATADALVEQAHHLGVDVILPVTDPMVAVAEIVRDRLPGGCCVAAADSSVLAKVRDKDMIVEMARGLGIPVPNTVVVHSVDEAVAASADFAWPVVVKPSTSVATDRSGDLHKLEVRYARDVEELADRIRPLEGLSPVLLQEYCTGHGVGIEVLARSGDVVAAFAHQRIREVPVSGGASSFRVSIPMDPELLAFSQSLMTSLDWTGLAMVEFKGAADGYRLMEINGRLWGSLPLAVRSGMDFPARYLHMLDGGTVPPGCDTDYRTGVGSRNVESEVIWAGSVLRGRRNVPDIVPFPPRREALRVLARLALPGDGYDILSWRDPLPGVAEVLRIVSKLGTKVSRG